MNTKRRFSVVVFFFVLLTAGVLVWLFLLPHPGKRTGDSILKGGGGMRVCPDQWIQNKMPSVGGNTRPPEYFIVDGTRRELYEFDMEWVVRECDISPAVVY